MRARARIGAAARWTAAAAFVGVAVGALTVALGWAVEASVAAFFDAQDVLKWLLPLSGAATFGLYRLLRLDFSLGTADVIEAARASRPVPLALAPGIFAGTCLTLLCGGSVGKEAAALQLGGSVSSHVGRFFGLGSEDCRQTLVMCGMAAALSAVLLAPLAAAVFVAEVMHRRLPHARCFLAPAASALVSYGVARLAGARLVPLDLPPVDLAGADLLATAALGAMAAVFAAAFCIALRTSRRQLARLGAPLLVLVTGGSLVSMVLGFTDWSPYGGTGLVQIDAALAGESLPAEAFLAKGAVTLLVLAAGLKGGEIMPVLCMGACLGSSFAAAAGLDGACMAALGMVGLFSACSNCPVASFILGMELFGTAGAPALLIVSLVGFALSYRCGLYQSAVIDWTPAGMLRRWRERAEGGEPRG
ncbi:chloride channel protein [Arabiibacter massiliensis]|uniref:chloride channel protein n=1 Tax=Arabiibacter massiliensis TaxID=1870985 RepID=UPI00155ADF8E|nr:chloride channel protein [Arabiibacter massiliensis]